MHSRGHIRVHNQELRTEALDCTVELSTNKSAERHKTSVTRSNSSKQINDESCTVQVPPCTSQINEWLARKAPKTIVSLPDSPEMKALKETCDALQKREQHVLSELDDFLMNEANQEQRKKEMLYQKWCERVFTPIHQAVYDKMQEENYSGNDRERRQLFDDYLAYCNQRIVFLDTISDDYKPLTHLPSPVKIKSEVSNDPLLTQQVEADSENVILRGCNIGYPPPKLSKCIGRKDTNPILWLAMGLAHIDSEVHCKRSSAIDKSRNKLNMMEDDGGLKLPHKRRITYKRQSFDLQWMEQTEIINKQ